LNQNNFTDLSDFGISHNLGLFLLLFPTVVSLLFLILLVKSLSKRTWQEVVNGTNTLRVNRLWTGAAVWGILLTLYFLVDYSLHRENFVFQFDLAKFIPLVLISLIMIPIQASSEEFFFRGYLAQGFAGWTKNRWVVIFIPSILFGLMHAANPEVKEFGFWLSMPQYILMGLFLGVIAVLDDGIELSIGAHAINNIFNSIVLTFPASALQTDALFEQHSYDPVKETVVLVFVSVIAIVFFAKKYHWNFGILNKKIKQNIEQ
jgi:membrane protease YdiL (CAAX protease family)